MTEQALKNTMENAGTDTMITTLVSEVDNLKGEMINIRNFNNYLSDKLEKVLGDRMNLRSENYKLKEEVKTQSKLEEPVKNDATGEGDKYDECLSCQ